MTDNPFLGAIETLMEQGWCKGGPNLMTPFEGGQCILSAIGCNLEERVIWTDVPVDIRAVVERAKCELHPETIRSIWGWNDYEATLDQVIEVLERAAKLYENQRA